MNGKRADVALLILRLGIGAVAMYYGSQKMFGAFNGPGVHGTIGYMKQAYGFPPVMAILAMCGEFLGGLGMFVGFLTSIAAFGFACTMAVATYENWQKPGLFQAVFVTGNPDEASKMYYPLVLFVAALAIMIMGGGAFSLDNRLFRRAPKGQKGPRPK